MHPGMSCEPVGRRTNRRGIAISNTFIISSDVAGTSERSALKEINAIHRHDRAYRGIDT